ncbi:MAG: PHP domain-containing protein, partial [Anaerolineae bacterium]
MSSGLRGFTHLQVHSHYTLLGGTAPVDELAARAAAQGMTRLALTDTNALYGAVAFARACRRAGIDPIVGMTATVAPPHERLGPDTSPGRLVLLATGAAGYRSLCQLSSRIQAEPQREALAARGLTWEDLHDHRAGLICLSGGRMGWVECLLRAGQPDAAARYAARLGELYGEDGYLSIEIHRPDDRAVAEEVAALGRRFGLRPVAVQPVYCLAPEEEPRLRLLAAIDHNVPLEAVPLPALPAHGDPNVGLHWLSPAEVAERFAGLPAPLANGAALATAAEVAARCGPALPGGEPIWPDLNLPQSQSPDEALAALARSGLEAHYGPEPPPAVRQRLEAELAAIAQHGYAPVFLVVADIARFARETDVPINTRGSVANSLVAYCSGITHVDPIAHDLLFERFLNPARADLPDIDLDFCSRQRDRVLEYV